jgi:outer membrane protein
MTLRTAATVTLAFVAAITVAAAATAAPVPAPMAAPATMASATPMPLTLTQAEDIALAQSPLLAVARAQLIQAQAGIGEARSGGLPDLGVSASSIRSKSGSSSGGFASPSPTSSPSTTGNTFVTSNSASATLHQLIIDGGRVHAEVQAAKYTADSSRLLLQRQIQTVEFDVASAYYAALQARHTLVVALDSLHLAQVQENLVIAQYKAGVASKADVLTAELPVAQAQLAVSQDQNGEQTQIAALLNAMGLDATVPVTVADEAPATIPLPQLGSVLSVAMKERPDLIAAQSSLDSANASLRATRLGLFPNISGVANDGTSATKVDTIPGTGNYANSYSVGVELSWPLYDGGLTRAQTVAAQAQADEAAADLKTASLGVSLNIEQSYLGVQTAQAGLTSADAEYAEAKTVLDVTNAQYKAGVTTLPLLLSAQVGLTKAEGDQVNAIYAYKTAWQLLLYSEGTIGPP